MNDRLVTSLSARFRRYQEAGDVAAILDDAAGAEIFELISRIGERTEEFAESINVGVLRLLGMVLLSRHRELPPGAGSEELKTALGIFADLHTHDPRHIPSFLRPMVELTWQNPHDNPVTRYDDARAAVQAFEDTGEPARLERATAEFRRALAGTPGEHPMLGGLLHDFSLALDAAYEQTGQLADLTEAIESSRRAVTALMSFGDARFVTLTNLCCLLTARYARTDQPADIVAAIRAGQEALDCTGSGHPHRGAFLTNLSSAYRRRFERSGQAADLDEALALARRAVGDSNANDRPGALSTLGVALRLRFEGTGQLSDLDEAVEVSRSATTKATHEDFGWLSNLGIALQRRFERTGQAPDLNEAIDVGRRAAAVIPRGHPNHERYLSNLAITLRLRGKIDDSPDVDEAIDLFRRAIASTSADNLERAGRLTNLGLALLARFDRDGLVRDLDDAIDACRSAVEARLEGDPNEAALLSNLASALSRRKNPADTAELTALFRKIVNNAEAPARVRIATARAWATRAMSDARIEQALEAYQAAIALLPVVAWHGLDRVTREHHLSEWVGLAADAAACAVTAKRYQLAVELLEHGRSVFWTSLLRFRSDLSALTEIDSDLAHRLNEIRVALDKPAAGEDSASIHSPSLSALSRDRRIALTHEWDRLVARVRTINGFGDFLTAPTFAELGRAAKHGPVVIVNLSRYRCDALIVAMKDGRPRVKAVPLPKLTGQEAFDRITALWRDLDAAAQPSAGFLGHERARHTVHDTLEWLWDAACDQILTAVGPADRIWWCPTGLLTFLPLHAAGHYPRTITDASQSDLGKSVPDRVITSYIPTLTALLRTRRRTAALKTTSLAVGIPEAVSGAPPLPMVAHELEVVAKYFPMHKGNRQLVSKHATRDTVQRALTEHPWVHLACHGGQNLLDPTAGGVLLWDGPLTVADIAKNALREAELAYLSACRTAVGGAELLDEAIHPAAALQVAGFRHVIATMWSISDMPAPDVADAFYKSLNVGGVLDPHRAAKALADAVTHLRAEYPTDPTIWAPYLHLGP
jgi:tetratricopeptide (TPR) repeat protein